MRGIAKNGVDGFAVNVLLSTTIDSGMVGHASGHNLLFPKVNSNAGGLPSIPGSLCTSVIHDFTVYR